MNKFRGKALALVLSLALVASSFPVTLASAASKTQTGLLTEDPDNDEFWLVNGGSSSDERSVEDFSHVIYPDGAPLEAKNGETVSDIEISSISHVSGDRVVKWDIDDNDDGDDDDTELSLRNSDSEGDEVIAILYKGTYTDDDDNEITVKASTQVTIHAVDKYATVIGDYDYTDPTDPGTDSPELEEGDDDFAAKTTAKGEDTKKLAVFRAVADGGDKTAAFAKWEKLKTVAKDDYEDEEDIPTDAYYTLDSSNDNIELSSVSGGSEGSDASATLSKSAGTEIEGVTLAKNSDLTKVDIAVTADALTTNPHLAYSKDGTTYTALTADGATVDFAGVTTGTIYITKDNTATPPVKDVTYGYTYTAATEPSEGTDENYVTAKVKPDSGSGNVTLTAELVNTDTTEDEVADDDDVKVKIKLAKKVLVNGNVEAETTGAVTGAVDVFEDGGKTYLKVNDIVLKEIDADTGEPTTDDDNNDVITNYGLDIAEIAGSPKVTVDDDAKLDSVTGTVGTADESGLIIAGAKVGTVDLDEGDVTVNDEDANVGDIHTEEDASDVTINAEVSVGNIETDAGVVTVDGAKTGDITTDGGTVDIKASDEETVVSVGTVTAKIVTIDPDDGQISVSKLVSDTASSSDDDASITLSGDSVKIGAIDFDSYATDLKTEDFQGSIPAPANATADGALIETSDEDDDLTVTGDLDIDGVTVDDEDSKLTLDGKADIGTLDGSGTLYVAKDALYIGDSASGVIVKLTDANVAAGDTIFTAASDAVDEDDLDFYGFTVSKDEGKDTDTFTVDELALAGLAASPASAKIALGYTQTLTATPYAPGTTLPEGYTIEWDIEDNSGVFDLVDNGDGTATVTTVDYDETFADENKATAIAYLVDEDGDEDEDYDEAEVDLTALKVPEATSDTTADFSVAPGASYTFKITSATQPTFTVGTAGVFNYALTSQSGNDYFYKITAIGNVGDEAGIYLNGEKLLVASIKSDIKSDTTQDVTVAKGSSYTYKITTSTSPSFAIGTAGAFTYSLVGRSGNDYFYKITAVGNAGAKAGIYVNGQKINVATVG